jgi:hypothetical protein
VAGPVDLPWADLRPLLRELWVETTACANWMVTELYLRDVRRQSGDRRLAPMPPSYLYPEARAQFKTLPSRTVAQLEQEVRRTYRAQRYELLWTRTRSLGTMRYPVPIPIPKQAWSLARSKGGAWHLSVALGSRRVVLRLQSAASSRRYVGVLDRIAASEVEVGRLALRQSVARSSDRRAEVLPDRRLIATIPVWMPRTSPQESSGSLTVRTGREAFFVACNEEGCEWRLHGGHIRRLLAYYARLRTTATEDGRSDRRHGIGDRAGTGDRLAAIARRRRGRLLACLHEASAHIAQYAGRCRVAKVVYDDRDRSGWPDLPWFSLKTLVREKLAIRGIDMEEATAPSGSDGIEER